MKRPAWQYFLGILAVFVLLRLPLFWIPIIDVDEAIYGLFSRIWFGGGLPYIDCVETKPLGIYLFYGLIFKLAGDYNMLGVHAVTVAWMLLTAFVLYLIVNLFGSRRGGIFAALFYAVFTTTYIPKIIATTIEPIMVLPLALQIYFWLKFERSGLGRVAFLSGVFLSAAMLFKYQAGINLVVMAVYVFAVKFSGRFKGFAYFLSGLIPLPLVMLAYLFKVGSLDSFVFWTLFGSLSYIGGGSASISVLHQILTRVLPFLAATALLWVLLVWRLATAPKFCREELLVFLWFLLSIVPVSTGFRFYGHYFLILLPPLCILAGHSLDGVFASERRRVLKLAVFLAILIPAIGFSVPRFFMGQIYEKVGEDNPKNYEPIAEYISSHTRPSEKIVVWGFAPLIYWYSERLPATRFFWSDLMVGRVPGAKPSNLAVADGTEEQKTAWKMFFEDLEKNKPVYFVDTTPAALHDYEHYPIRNYPKLEKYLNEKFVFEAEVSGAAVYRALSATGL